MSIGQCRLAGCRNAVSGSSSNSSSKKGEALLQLIARQRNLNFPAGAKDSYSITVSKFEKNPGYKVDVVEWKINAQENLTKICTAAV